MLLFWKGSQAFSSMNNNNNNNGRVGIEAEKNMDSIFQQNFEWRWRTKKRDPNFFKKSSDKKPSSPNCMWIGSSELSVPASTIMGEDPGNVLVTRNIANLVVNTDFNLMGALQYAVDVLDVPHIIVCGHYDCASIKSAMKKIDHGPPLENWLRNIRDVYRLHRKELDAIEDSEQRHRRLVELNVVEQCLNLVKTGVVQRKCVSTHQDEDKPFATPRIHACVYDEESGELKRLKIEFGEAIDELGDMYDLINDYDEIPDSGSEKDVEYSTKEKKSAYTGTKRRWDVFSKGEGQKFEAGKTSEKEFKVSDSNEGSKSNAENVDDFKNLLDTELSAAATAIIERTDYQVENLSKEISDLRATVHLLENFETIAVQWEIPLFERSLTETRATYRSNDFPIDGYMMHLEFVVMSAAESQLRHRDREVSAFIANSGGANVVMPIEMPGTTFTLIASDPADDLECVAESDFKIVAPGSGYGWTKFTSLNELREKYIDIKGSINMEAVVRVRKIRRCSITP